MQNVDTGSVFPAVTSRGGCSFAEVIHIEMWPKRRVNWFQTHAAVMLQDGGLQINNGICRENNRGVIARVCDQLVYRSWRRCRA